MNEVHAFVACTVEENNTRAVETLMVISKSEPLRYFRLIDGSRFTDVTSTFRVDRFEGVLTVLTLHAVYVYHTD